MGLIEASAIAKLPAMRLLAGLLLLPGAAATWYNYSGINGASGCGMVCADSTDYLCLGTFPSLQQCASACQASPACASYTFSAGTHHCWTRRDAQWFPAPVRA